MKLACSYNHHFSTGRLLPNKNIKIIELGFKAYNDLFFNKNTPEHLRDIQLSLHISRSPITEPIENQNIFISEKLSEIKNDDRIISIGFHLCGHRNDNIGKYGFSSHYSKTLESECNAIEFIKNVTCKTNKPVWLENANFYSSSAEEVIENWISFNKIIKKSNAKSIIDLSHLIIDCKNNNISPYLVIGFIDWSKVIEVHLSGIIIGNDGALHDGHSVRVSSLVWEMLEQLIKSNLVKKSIIFNIEHSDNNWADEKEIYNADFDILNNILNMSFSEGVKNSQANKYALGYLRKLLTEEIENLEEISEHFNSSIEEILNSWIEHIVNIEKRISLSSDDMDSLLAKNSVHFVQSFIEFIELKQI